MPARVALATGQPSHPCTQLLLQGQQGSWGSTSQATGILTSTLKLENQHYGFVICYPVPVPPCWLARGALLHLVEEGGLRVAAVSREGSSRGLVELLGWRLFMLSPSSAMGPACHGPPVLAPSLAGDPWIVDRGVASSPLLGRFKPLDCAWARGWTVISGRAGEGAKPACLEAQGQLQGKPFSPRWVLPFPWALPPCWPRGGEILTSSCGSLLPGRPPANSVRVRLLLQHPRWAAPLPLTQP